MRSIVAVDDLEEKMNAMIFHESITSVAASLEQDLEAAQRQQRCAAVVDPPDLMQKILAVGNAMNAGSSKGSAAGFTLSSSQECAAQSQATRKVLCSTLSSPWCNVVGMNTFSCRRRARSRHEGGKD